MFFILFVLYFAVCQNIVQCSYAGDDYSRTNFQGAPFNRNPLKTIRDTLHLLHIKHPHVLEVDCFLNTCKYDRALAIIQDNAETTFYWSVLNCDKYGVTCPVNGQWGSWGSWSECPQACGPAQQVRYRECSAPHPQYNGAACNGKNHQFQDCSPKYGAACIIDEFEDVGVWSEWSSWSKCSKSCGTGSKDQSRKCMPPMYSSKCVGKSTRAMPCRSILCETSGNWGVWGSWGECSTKLTCGSGYQLRVRTCSDPYPIGKNRDCVGASSQLQDCKQADCMVKPPITAHFVGNSFVRYRYINPSNFLNIFVKFMPTSLTGTIIHYSSLDAEFLHSMVTSQNVEEDYIYAYITSRDNIRVKASVNRSTEIDMLVGFARTGSWNDLKISVVSDSITARLNSGENVHGKLWQYPDKPVENEDSIVENLQVPLINASNEVASQVESVKDSIADKFRLEERKIFAKFDGQIVLGKARVDIPSFRGTISDITINFKPHSLQHERDTIFPPEYSAIGTDYVDYSQGQKHDFDASLPYFHGNQVVKIPLPIAWWYNGEAQGKSNVAHFEIVFKPETPDGILLYSQGKYNKACFIKLFLMSKVDVKLMVSLSGRVSSVHATNAIKPGKWNHVKFHLVNKLDMKLNVNGKMFSSAMPIVKELEDLGNVLYIGGAKQKSASESEIVGKNPSVGAHIHWFQGFVYKVTLNQFTFNLQTATLVNSHGMLQSGFVAKPKTWQQFTFVKEVKESKGNKTIVPHKLICIIPQISDRELRYTVSWSFNDVPIVPHTEAWITEERVKNTLRSNLFLRGGDDRADMSGVYQCHYQRNEKFVILSTFVVAMLSDEQTSAGSIKSVFRQVSATTGINVVPFIVLGVVIVLFLIALLTMATIRRTRENNKYGGKFTREEVVPLERSSSEAIYEQILDEESEETLLLDNSSSDDDDEY